MILKIIKGVKPKFYRIINSSVFDYFSTEPVYVFHHIPKCGGTSINYAFEHWFKVIYDYRDNFLFRERFDISGFKKNYLLASHFDEEGNRIFQRYPELFDQKRYRIITFVRDPIEMNISLYYYWKRKGWLSVHGFSDTISHEEFLLKVDKNLMAFLFGCNNDNIEDVLSKYFFIGITELFQESFDKLSYIINKPIIKLSVLNKSDRFEIKDIDPSVISLLRNQLQLDYKIYSYCLEKFKSY